MLLNFEKHNLMFKHGCMQLRKRFLFLAFKYLIRLLTIEILCPLVLHLKSVLGKLGCHGCFSQCFSIEVMRLSEQSFMLFKK